MLINLAIRKTADFKFLFFSFEFVLNLGFGIFNFTKATNQD
jgi:hypothetical protein